MNDVLIPVASALFGALLASLYWTRSFAERLTRVETKLDMLLGGRVHVDPGQMSLLTPEPARRI